jgi:hypothetical protein
MPKFLVNYSTSTNWEIEVEADSDVEAQSMIEDGSIDLDLGDAIAQSDDIVVNNVEEITE